MDNKAASPKRSLSRRYGASLTVGLIGLALSLMAFFAVGKWAAKWRASDFDRLAEVRCELFDREVAGSIIKLTALKQFFDGSQFVDRYEFANFIDPLHEMSPHSLAFFWSPQVLETDRHLFEGAVRAEGFSDFAIHCDSPVDGIAAVTQRERYYPVLYYCHESNWAMGLDLLGEPQLRKAIEQAVDADQPVVLGLVVFPGGQNNWSGVAVLHAVYHKGLPTTTVEERRCAIEGVVVCAMQLGEILEDVIQTLTPVGIDIQVADLSTPEGKQILYQYSARLQCGDPGDTLNEISDASGLIYATTFDVAGHTWELRCTPSTGYLAAHPLRTHWIVLLGGLILTALLTVQFYMMRNRTAIVEAIVDERTAQLRETTDYLQNLFDYANAPIIVWDPEFKITRFNHAFENMTQRSADEVLGKPLSILFPEESLEQAMTHIDSTLSGERWEAVEIPILRADGEVRIVLWNSAGIHSDKADSIIATIAQGQDITERMQAEEALRESEERYHRITDAVTDYIYTVRIEDGQPAETIHGHACEAVTGHSSEEFRIDPYLWIQMIPQEDRDPVRDQVSRVLSGDDPEPIEHRLMRKDGNVRWVTSVLVAHRDGRGNLLSYDGLIRDITERKRAEEALRESEERFRTIFETAEDSIFIKDRNLRYTMVNPAMERLLGMPVSQIIGKTDSEIFGEETGAHIREVDTRVLNGEILREEHTKPVNEVPFTFNVVKVPMRDDAGDIIGLCGIARDITERKRAEETLKQSAKNYRDLFNNATDAIYIQDKEGRFLDVNRGAVDMYGYPKECFIGKTPEFLSAPGKNDMKKIIGFVEDAFNGKPRQYDFWGIRKSGEVFPKIVRSQRGLYQGQKVIITFALDITERKQAEADRIRLSRAIEQVDETVVITDAEGTIQYVNPAFEKTSGYSVEEAIGQHPRMLNSGKHDDAFYEKMWETLLRGEEWRGDIINKKKDGTLFTEGVTISPVFDSGGRIVNYVAAKHDITEISRLQELETRAQRLESAGSIAGQVAHDFNNLLGPLMAYPELIREELPEDHKVLTFLSSIETAAEQMADINQDLLTMGRRGHYNMKPMNMNEVVLQAVKELKPLPETLVCETNLDKDLMNILGGPSQIYRAIANILHNARDAMHDIGTITIKTENYYADDVTVAYNRVPRGEYVKLTISDTGSGIPDDIVEKIFDPFFTSKATDKKRGSGLGMSVVDAVIKDHKGYTDLTTKVGEGTSFYLYFPVTREAIEAQETDQITGGCETVLVIDDDDVQRDIARSLLERLGYKVSVAESGEKAIEFLRDNPQDLLILDMIMPSGMDGANTYSKAVEIYPEQKAIVVSGYSETERVQKVQSLGAGAFIKKPITLQKIAGAVRKELDREVEVTV